MRHLHYLLLTRRADPRYVSSSQVEANIPLEGMLLVHAGRRLTDDKQTLNQLGIVENDVLLVNTLPAEPAPTSGAADGAAGATGAAGGAAVTGRQPSVSEQRRWIIRDIQSWVGGQLLSGWSNRLIKCYCDSCYCAD